MLPLVSRQSKYFPHILSSVALQWLLVLQVRQHWIMHQLVLYLPNDNINNQGFARHEGFMRMEMHSVNLLEFEATFNEAFAWFLNIWHMQMRNICFMLCGVWTAAPGSASCFLMEMCLLLRWGWKEPVCLLTSAPPTDTWRDLIIHGFSTVTRGGMASSM